MSHSSNLTLKWSWSFAFHVLILGVLFFNFKQASHFAPVATAPNPTIEAVAIDQEQVQAEVDRLKAIDEKKQQEEKKRLADLDRKAKEAEKERKLEQAKLEKLKKEAEQVKLAKLEAEKQRKEQEKQRLKEMEAAEKLRKEQVVEAQKVAKLKEEQKVLEEEKKKAAVKEKESAEKEKKLAQEKKAEEAKRAKIAADKKAREEAEAALQDAIAREGVQQRYQTELQQYMARIQRAISDLWVRPIGVSSGLKCVVEVRLSASGEVLQAKVIRTSGNVAFDRSSEAAIRKASPLPVPTDAHLFNEFKNFNFTFNPESV